MEKRDLAALIRKRLAGRTTPQENEHLEKVWQQAQEDESYLQSLPESEREALQASMYQHVWQAIRKHETQPAPLPAPLPEKIPVPARVLPLRSFPYRAVAASVALLLILGFFAHRLLTQSQWQVAQTDFGKKREIVLPDESVVILNGHSSIRYATHWDSQQPREVWLEGEAYFSVQHTRSHQKFIVHTPDQLKIEVLGTKFNVLNRRGDTKVVLQEGKVQVSDASKNYVMHPGEMISYVAKQARLIPSTINPKPVVSWKDKVRLFHDETLQSIFEELEDSHGIRVEYRNDAIRRELFSGSVPSDSVEQLFEKIEKIYSIKVTQKEGVYVLQ